MAQGIGEGEARLYEAGPAAAAAGQVFPDILKPVGPGLEEDRQAWIEQDDPGARDPGGTASGGNDKAR